GRHSTSAHNVRRRSGPATSAFDAAHDPGGWHRPPIAAVVTFAAIVAHDEEVARRDLDRRRQVALVAPTARDGEGPFVHFFTVDHSLAFLDRERVAPDRDDPLEE